MIHSGTARTPARLLSLFSVLTVLPLAALGWLGWRLLEQDRILEVQRTREGIETAAALFVREIEDGLQNWETMLPVETETMSRLRPDAVLLVLNSHGVLKHRGMNLPYYPGIASRAELPVGVFDAAEAEEFRVGGMEKAANLYRTLTSSNNQSVRAAALSRLARCLRKQQMWPQAITVYGDLAGMEGTPVFGSPARLLAHHERIAVWKAAGNEPAAGREAAHLSTALAEGRFALDHATFEFFRESVPMPPIDPKALLLAVAAKNLWPAWQEQASGRTASISGRNAIISVWRRTPAGTAAIFGDIDSLLAPTSRNLQSGLTLETLTGELVWGTLPASGGRITKSLLEIGLPLTIRAAPPRSPDSVFAGRRNLLIGGFVFLIFVLVAASYFVFYAVNREIKVARLQSDFVSAVSHEFRTPLTAMCHLTEMLEDGIAAPDRVPDYYRALRKETHRLQALVESLLDFGRMESGNRTYQMEDTNATELVSSVLDQFREQSPVVADRLHWQRPSGDWRIRADYEALALAVRNLVDNAMKYAPASSPVTVAVARIGDYTSISVEDRGPGIAIEEQRDVFRKFVRGASSKSNHVKGSGLGLAIVDQIVKAHGGRVELASNPGHGSRFSILLPSLEEQS